MGVPITANLVIYGNPNCLNDQALTLAFVTAPVGGVSGYAGVQIDFMAIEGGAALVSLSTGAGTLTLTDATNGIWTGTLTKTQVALLVSTVLQTQANTPAPLRRVFFRVFRTDASPNAFRLGNGNIAIAA